MDQGVIVVSKRLHQQKYLEEVFKVLEEEDDLVEEKQGEKTLQNIKNYSIKTAIYNLSDVWNSLKKKTMVNAWSTLFVTGKNVENKLKEFSLFVEFSSICVKLGIFVQFFRREEAITKRYA